MKRLALALCLVLGCDCGESMVVGELDGGAMRPDGPRPLTDECGNGMDDDRNGRIDDGCPCAPGEMQRCFGGEYPSRGVGICMDGMQTCNVEAPVEFGDWGAFPCEGDVLPAEEMCDGMDHDCDGIRDEGCPCTAGQERECGERFPDEPPCRSGVQRCDAEGSWTSFCEGAVGPVAEVCDDGVDNDCNGTVDPDSLCSCIPVPEICANDVDDDCDGRVDEPEACSPSCIPVPEVCGDGVDQDCSGADTPCADAGVDGCVPRTCGAIAAGCGSHDDGCGNILECGPCGVSCTSTPRRILEPTPLIIDDDSTTISEGYVYLRTHEDGFLRVPLSGGAAETISTRSADAFVAADAANALLGTAGGSGLGSASILAVAPDGTGLPAELFRSTAGFQSWPRQLELTPTHVFTVSQGNDEAGVAGPGMLRIDRSDGSYVRLFDASPRGMTFRSDGSHFYWAEDESTRIVFSRAPREGGPIERLGHYDREAGDALAYLLGMGLDETYVYGATGPVGTLVRVPRGGGPVTTFHTSEGYTRGNLIPYGTDLLFSVTWHTDRPTSEPGIYAIPRSGGTARLILPLPAGDQPNENRLIALKTLWDCLLYARKESGAGIMTRWDLWLVEL